MIFHLPAELTIKCLQQADVADIARCKCTCNAFNQLINDSLLLQYELILKMHGYDHAVISRKASTSEYLDELSAHVDAWQDPNFLAMNNATVLSPKWEGTTYELQGGLFISGHPQEFGGRFTQSLTFLELPWRNQNMDV
ncbi:hypothetical protein FRB95_000085 [Tulasnella sp. JGI-2019a]|nr:hypothetical protein FRB95_000085 [Tulasnella sp. JGI-2019a]